MTGTVQAATFAQSIVAKNPPPEGTMGVKVTYLLTSADYIIAANYQLGSPGGLSMSQVVTLVIDNTTGSYPVIVTHGVMVERCVVPAGVLTTVPTFSSTVAYVISIETLSAPDENQTVVVTFLNYERQSGSVPNTVQNTIVNTGQNSSSIYSNAFGFNGPTYSIQLAQAGNWILDSLDLACEAFAVETAGAQGDMVVTITCGSVVIETHNPQYMFPPSNGWVPGVKCSYPASRTWSQGLILPRGYPILFKAVFIFPGGAGYRVNISGFQVP